ncbi:MAG: hypothetical protein RML94_13105 [Bacteroidia bacterium]|nr:hypothetical protein [Bacteroidia bacterium]
MGVSLRYARVGVLRAALRFGASLRCALLRTLRMPHAKAIYPDYLSQNNCYKRATLCS